MSLGSVMLHTMGTAILDAVGRITMPPDMPGNLPPFSFIANAQFLLLCRDRRALRCALNSGHGNDSNWSKYRSFNPCRGSWRGQHKEGLSEFC